MLENNLDKSLELILGIGGYSYEHSVQCWLDMIDPMLMMKQ
jgi:hypothetical protein